MWVPRKHHPTGSYPVLIVSQFAGVKALGRLNLFTLDLGQVEARFGARKPSERH